MGKALTITETSRLLRNREISCVELTQEYLAAIERDNPTLNAYVYVTAEQAKQAAAAFDQRFSAGEELPPLAGVPMTLKDNISTKGMLTQCCSRILDGYVPFYNATVWDTLYGQGAVLLGKTNMDEFAMGSSSETSCHGGSRNPYRLEHVAGGSSGGGASAVAGGLAVYALGSDTGGSIRQPASFCGIVGLKPTYGAVSRYGLIAYASSLDQIGPLTNTVEDAALVYDAISIHDPRDSTSVGHQGVSAVSELKKGIRGIRIGIVREYFDGITGAVRSALESAMERYKILGAELVEISIPQMKYALPVYYILACAEAASNLGRYDGIRYGYRTESYKDVDDMVCKTRSEGFGTEVKRRILLGNYVLSAGYFDAYYKKAQNLRGAIVRAFSNAFSKCDIMLAPTVPTTAFPENFTQSDPVQTYLTDICTVPVNIVGLPALSMPCGADEKGLPIGMQLIGPKFSENRLLSAAWNFEQDYGSSCGETLSWGVRK